MGFSLIGTVIVVLMLLPSIIFFSKFPPKNVPQDMKNAPVLFTIMERIGQIGCFTILVISKDYFQISKINIWTVLMLVCMIVYYCLWIRYVIKGQDSYLLCKPLLFIPIPLAVFPVCVFGFSALWRNSVWLGIATCILAIGHLTVSWISYKEARRNKC